MRWMNGVSSKPLVVTNATLEPVRSISAFVPTVVPCVNVSIAAGATPPSSSALTIARPGVLGVDDVFSESTWPVAGSNTTMSVNVPPVSMPMTRPMR